MPIKWFGNREAYFKSPIKIITVGLNPSDMEFRKTKGDRLDTIYRFPQYNGTEESLDLALDNYFETTPYEWFLSFEHILKGLDASYYAKSNRPNRVIHTDFCTCWATDPTWSRLSKDVKTELMIKGVKEWQDLVTYLKPDIILFSIPKEYVNILGTDVENTIFTQFDKTKNDKTRKRPVEIRKGCYNGAISILGRTWNLPFGALGAEQKVELGKLIKSFYEQQK